MVTMIVLHANKYDADFINNLTVTRSSRFKSWTPTYNSEIKTFLIILCEDIVKMPDIYSIGQELNLIAST